MSASSIQGITLVLGGARSGKSAFAESLCADFARAVYLATAEAHDDEMRARIAHHRERRGADWVTVEEPLALGAALAAHAAPGAVVLVDCLTLWLANLMGAGRDLDREAAALVESLPALAGPVVMVSNEVGWGIVPDNPAARAFRDAAGRLHQAIAAHATRVYLVVAGIPTTIKDHAG